MSSPRLSDWSAGGTLRVAYSPPLVAGQQQESLGERRAAMSMARLWRDQGKRDEARNLLAPVYNWFNEGSGTLDLKEAEALLKVLAA
jgi:predicted ATPase